VHSGFALGFRAVRFFVCVFAFVVVFVGVVTAGLCCFCGFESSPGRLFVSVFFVFGFCLWFLAAT